MTKYNGALRHPYKNHRTTLKRQSSDEVPLETSVHNKKVMYAAEQICDECNRLYRIEVPISITWQQRVIGLAAMLAPIVVSYILFMVAGLNNEHTQVPVMITCMILGLIPMVWGFRYMRLPRAVVTDLSEGDTIEHSAFIIHNR